jgi:hypothetical protein
VVLEAEHELRGRCVTVSLLLYEDGGVDGQTGKPHFAPLWKIAAFDPATKTCYLEEDHLGHGDALVVAGTGLAEPAWSTVGGTAYVQVWQWAGVTNADDQATWTSIGVVQVSSVDLDAGTVVLATDPGILRDAEYWLGMPSYDHPNCPAWAKAIYGIVVKDTRYGGTVPTLGRKYTDAP